MKEQNRIIESLKALAVIAFGLVLNEWEQAAAAKRAAEHPDVQLAWVQLAYMVIMIGLSYLAGQILAKKNKNPVDKDKPTTLTTRGAYMAWHLGIRRIGPVFAWAGDRETREEDAGGGKGGGGGGEVDIFYEAGWHQICVGPTDALIRIVQGGKTIFSGPIPPESHPSGTSVDLGKEGRFTIYWGEPTQLINTFLGNSSRVGVSSRWPFCCYVVWNKKRLSTSPNWPILDYVVERRPVTTLVTGSQGWYDPTATLDGPTFTVVDFNASSNEDVGYLEILGNATTLDPGRIARVSGNGMGTGDFVVLRTVPKTVQTGVTPSGFPIYSSRTEIYFEGGTVGADDQGTVQEYSFAKDDGANIAHCIAEMLHEPWPTGLSVPHDGPEVWNLPSLEAWGAEAEANGWRASLVSVDGEDADSILGAALQDHGVMLPLNGRTGELTYKLIREPSGTLPNIPRQLYSDELPEIETLHGEPNVDKIVFEFTDREHDFGTMTIAVDSDGSASYLEHKRANKVAMPSTTHFPTAADLAEVRSQEELAGGGEFRLRCSRGARLLEPGDAITAEDFEEVLRVSGVKFDPLSEEVSLSVMPDFYGARKSDFVNEQGGGAPNFQDPALDEQFLWVEVPEQLLAAEEMVLLCARIRAHEQIVSSAIHLSRDNLTYTLNASQTGVATGGTLDVALPDTGKMFEAIGPEFTLLGPDATSAQDLSADLTNWGLGRQLCVIVSSAGTEIAFVQKITAIGGDTYRLDGLLRGRFDTRKLDHPTSAQVYIFSDTALRELRDILLVPGEDLYIKSQPSTTAGSVPIESIPPYSESLRGKGLVPIDVENLRTSAPHLGTNSYHTGDDVTVKWSWSTASSTNTGAGRQNAGDAIGFPSLKGSFIVELLTTGDVLVQQDTVLLPTITYDNATLAASPISEGDFKVRITHSNNGYLSTPVELTITKN